MQAEALSPVPAVWRGSPVLWALLAVAAALLAYVFRVGLGELVRVWSEREEYGYGFAVPMITAFLIWQRKHLLERQSFDGAWSGTVLVALGLAMFMLSRVSTVMILTQLSFLATLIGLALALLGQRGLRIVLVPLLMLAFMIPLPLFILNELSFKLQLLSSSIGVFMIRLFDISVYLDGNVIDLGAYKLQVAEACNGLRYLFPLMTLAFIAAYFFKVEFWKRALVFLSAIPITVLMNSARIAAIGITVQYWGTTMAEGVLHDFEGWVVFMACVAILVFQMWLLTKIGRVRRPLREAFGLDWPDPTPANAVFSQRRAPPAFIAAVALLAVAAFAATFFPVRMQTDVPRKDFLDFPMRVGGWTGQRERLDRVFTDILQMDDYLLADFSRPEERAAVNFLAVYYNDQSSGRAVHSPRACIPAGGWAIVDSSERTLAGVMAGQEALRVNRAVIQKGDARQLVYYWFQQRGRVITSEYGAKWFILLDSLQRSRTDGSLVRLVTAVAPGESLELADARLTAFAGAVAPKLNAFIPD